MIKKIILILLLVILVFGFIMIYPVLFQEGNPLPILKGIIELSFTNSYIIKISDEPQIYITKTNKGNSPIIELMEKEGWKFGNQAGSGYLFSKGGNKKVISSVQYTSKYIIWEIPNIN